MINHFRTLLLNRPTTMPAAGDPLLYQTLHLAPRFPGVILPPDLQRVHDLLFAGGPADDGPNWAPGLLQLHRHLMVQNYQVLLRGCGMEAFMAELDPRMTFRYLEETDAFQPWRTGNGFPEPGAFVPPPGTVVRMFNLVRKPALIPPPPEAWKFPHLWMTTFANRLVFNDAVQNNLLVVTPVFDSRGQSQVFTVPLAYQRDAGTVDVILQTRDFNEIRSGTIWWLPFSQPAAAALEPSLAAALAQQAMIDQVLARRPGLPDPVSYDRQWRDHFSGMYRLAGLAAGVVCRINHLLGGNRVQ